LAHVERRENLGLTLKATQPVGVMGEFIGQDLTATSLFSFCKVSVRNTAISETGELVELDELSFR
jgi:hypothetical protein